MLDFTHKTSEAEGSFQPRIECERCESAKANSFSKNSLRQRGWERAVEETIEASSTTFISSPGLRFCGVNPCNLGLQRPFVYLHNIQLHILKKKASLKRISKCKCLLIVYSIYSTSSNTRVACRYIKVITKCITRVLTLKTTSESNDSVKLVNKYL